jgi:hypothetical protein
MREVGYEIANIVDATDPRVLAGIEVSILLDTHDASIVKPGAALSMSVS